ncbi:MAG: glycosyltransferase family 9 protein [Myxococcota bacterium]
MLRPLEGKSLRKRLELFGRRVLVALFGFFRSKRQGELLVPSRPRLLVLRLDERLGNVIMLTPLLCSLRARFPDASIEVLGSARSRALLEGHPAVDEFLQFRKRALFASDGPLRTCFALRRRGYSVAIDASNPTDPSLTQAILTAASGAEFTVGSAARGYGGFFTHPVQPDPAARHEIDHRLNLLSPLPGEQQIRTPSLAADPRAVEVDEPYVVLNVGARLLEKRLSVEEYASVAEVCAGFRPVVLTWGPGEFDLAQAVASRCENAVTAPATGLDELAVVLGGADAVVSCDTGPMHLAVALGRPTLGIFVATDPARYGYPDAPHAVLDARGGWDEVSGTVEDWLAGELVS